jgi:hypothetical protein
MCGRRSRPVRSAAVDTDRPDERQLINTALDQPAGPNLQVQNAAGATPGNECQTVAARAARCVDADTSLVRGLGGNDKLVAYDCWAAPATRASR